MRTAPLGLRLIQWAQGRRAARPAAAWLAGCLFLAACVGCAADTARDLNWFKVSKEREEPPPQEPFPQRESYDEQDGGAAASAEPAPSEDAPARPKARASDSKDSGGGGLFSWTRGKPASDDLWAIRCISIRGPQRFATADSYAEAIRKVKGLKPDLIAVFDVDAASNVYYGRYERRYNERNGQESFRPDPLADLELIRKLSFDMPDDSGTARPVWPFLYATMESLPTTQTLPPEWCLDHAVGQYSLQIAVFYNSEQMRQRKSAAEQYCQLLREQGEEAYYYHGEQNSIVCVGAFPASAIESVKRTNPLTGSVEFSAKIVDERMLALQRKYPHNTHNGHIFYERRRDPTTGKVSRDAHTSFPVLVPRRESSFE